MATVLIIGGSGKLGSQLIKLLPEALHPTSEELDITSKASVKKYILQNQPEYIIHCAALTDVRKCELNPTLAWNINFLGTSNLIEACEAYIPKCYFIFISTACVFSGDSAPYNESSVPKPKNFYAITKFQSETYLKFSSLQYLIIRTNFVERKPWLYPSAFTDRFGTYLFADDVAKAIISVVLDDFRGTIHICGSEKLSMFELAKITTPNIKPMTIKDYVGPPLTMDMSLISERIEPFHITKYECSKQCEKL